MKLLKENSAFFGLLSAVWVYLLGLCLLIGYLIVPIPKDQYSMFVTVLIDGSKILISMIFILLWLVSWYKVLGLLFYYELSLNDEINSTDSQ
ncbi:MAG: hypothetical protein INQ03_07560 [Candidatus Heimdallarchaeota archaeon]|nr:hypothetical protein [Candidatus Heimdallarchaeota archaeon]